jgi:glyoxylase-like metal-dependent hydrolase (beta-lactamase superfamily II)
MTVAELINKRALPDPPALPRVEPYRIAEDSYLIPNLVPAEPGTFVMVNTMVILPEQPIVVDTGAPLHREQWRANVSTVVDPTDVRWVFLSHDDGDHLGNMLPILDLAPDTTTGPASCGRTTRSPRSPTEPSTRPPTSLVSATTSRSTCSTA